MSWNEAARWGGTSGFVDIDGPVHVVDFGGAPDGPSVVLVHGLGGSHLNWCLLAPLLTPHARVVAIDLAGFGLTASVGRSSSVRANTALLDRFLRREVGEPTVLVGNSMGGLISARQAAHHPETVRGLVLVDPALPLVGLQRPDPMVAWSFLLYATPVAGRRLLTYRRARMTPRQLVMQTLELCCVDPARVPEELIAASCELVERRRTMPGGDDAFFAAARSILRTNADSRRAWATLARIAAPVLLLHGERDRLVSLRQAQSAALRNPSWTFESFAGVGHVPQLEVPGLVADRVLSFMGSLRAQPVSN
jgi:pimeloyl-ACP methyl ester carboxylesterase